MRFRQISRTPLFVRLAILLALGALVWLAVRSAQPTPPDGEAEPASEEQAGCAPYTPAWAAGLAAEPRRAATERLGARRYVAAGDRAYLVGTANGSFPPMGWHIRGEMGGVWADPLKLLDGVWVALDDEWLRPATCFVARAGFVQMGFRPVDGLTLSRTDFAPDGLPAVLVGLTLHNAGAEARTVALTLDARSDLRASYPWSWSEPWSAADVNGTDAATFDAETGWLRFAEAGKPWHARVAGSVVAESGATGNDFWGPLGRGERLQHSLQGGGAGGQLRWRVEVPAGEERTLWIAVAGSHRSEREADEALRAALADPAALLAAKVAARTALLAQSQLRVPDPLLQDGWTWGTLNLADLRLSLTDVPLRDVDEGRAYPEPVATVPTLAGVRGGFPDYPHLFATDGAYSAYALVASGQWETAMAHLRAIRDVSRAINGATGKVVHEVETDGSVYFGTNEDAGNANETAQFAVAVELLWRWAGDDGFRDEMYPFVRDGMRTLTTEGDRNGNGCPEGSGMVERAGMADEKLDVAAYTWQGLHALRRMAASRGDAETAAWAGARADALAATFDAGWWMAGEGLYADSSSDCAAPDAARQQRHWTVVTPMEVGLAPAARAVTALDRLASPDFSGAGGLFHTGAGGGPSGEGERKAWTLPTSAMAVAEATYGRTDRALRAMRAIASTLDLEMAGALPEIAASPDYDPFGDFLDRAMVMQAWSPYGIHWPLVHHFLGIRPDAPARHLTVVPQLPAGWPTLAIQNLRLGTGTVAVSVTRQGDELSTTVAAPPGWTLTLGQTLPPGSAVVAVELDGVAVGYEVVETLRGREVRVETTTDGARTLVVRMSIEE